MAIKDELVDCAAKNEDLADNWKALKDLFVAGDSSQVLVLSNKLYTMRMAKGGNIKEYIIVGPGDEEQIEYTW